MGNLQPCPACGGSGKLWNRNTGTYRNRNTVFYVTCNRCLMRGPMKDSDGDAVGAWNSLPRRFKWVTYDGTDTTLPSEDKTVLVEISFPGHSNTVTFYTVAKCKPSTLNGSIWWERPMADPWEVVVGNRWLPWPKVEE